MTKVGGRWGSPLSNQLGRWPRSVKMNAKEKAAMDAGVQFGMNMLKLVPSDDRLAQEAHITGVLVAFMGALWGTLGTEYARGFIEAQLRGMEPDVPHERFTAPRVQ